MNGTALLPIRQNTSLVSFSIRVNGADLPQTISVRSISVYREVNRIPTARLFLADGDAATGQWNVSSGDLFVPGSEIEILAGYHREDELVFKGIVTKQAIRLRRQQLELDVECKDNAVKMTLGRRSRLFQDKTDSDIAQEILDEYGLAGELAGTTLSHPKMIQYHSSDWDFLLSRLDANGLVCAVRDGVVDCLKPELTSEAEAILRLGTNLLAFEAEIDARKQPQTVKALAWDSSGQEVAEAEAEDPGWGTPGNFAAADLATAAGAEQLNLRHSGPLSADELQQWADACLLRSRMAFVRGRAQVQGFAGALPGMTIALEGLGDRFNGKVWISGIRHELSRGSWLTDLQIGLSEQPHIENYPVQAPPAGMLLPAIQGLHTGVVTQLADDPDGEHRIKVKIPSIDASDEGVWARVATLDAGDTRGSFFLPEIDDEVLVGFLENDPRYPVVLGMLHSSAKPAPLSASDDNHEKGYQSRSGIKLIFNDDKTTVTLETPAGNTLLLDDDGGQIALSDQNGNKITLSSDGIVLESAKDLQLKASANIKLEAQAKLDAKAGAKLTAEGSAGLEATSSGVTTIKGSLVQIN